MLEFGFKREDYVDIFQEVDWDIDRARLTNVPITMTQSLRPEADLCNQILSVIDKALMQHYITCVRSIKAYSSP
jgi:hypothetical protein